MPASSSGHWILSLLQRILQLFRPLANRSFSIIQALLTFLRRCYKKPPGGLLNKGGSVTSGPPEDTLHVEHPWSRDVAVICASNVPNSLRHRKSNPDTAPSSSTGSPAGPSAPLQPSAHLPRPAPVHEYRSALFGQHLSEAGPSTAWPYLPSQPYASRSAHDLHTGHSVGYDASPSHLAVNAAGLSPLRPRAHDHYAALHLRHVDGFAPPRPRSVASPSASYNQQQVFLEPLTRSISDTGRNGANFPMNESVVSLAPSWSRQLRARTSTSQYLGRRSPRPISSHSVQIVPNRESRAQSRAPSTVPPISPLPPRTESSRSSRSVHLVAVEPPSRKPTQDYVEDAGPSRSSRQSMSSVGSSSSVTDPELRHVPPSNASETSLAQPEGATRQPSLGHLPAGMEMRIVFPMTPAWSERYSRKSAMKIDEPRFTVPPMQRSFERDDVPLGWSTQTHPDGTLLFYHSEKRVITDAWICEHDILEEVEMFYVQVIKLADDDNFSVPDDAQLVLELMPSSRGEETICGYYFVDHNNRTLFWLREFEIDWILQRVTGQVTLSHFRHKLEAEYWNHLELYPGLHSVPKAAWDELWSILVHGCCDTLTSQSSTVPYDTSQFEKILFLVNNIRNEDFSHNTYLETVLGRLMSCFLDHKFLHFHGQKYPRLDRDQTLYPDERRKTSLSFTLISPLLFSAPDVHMRHLDRIFVDHIISEVSWKTFIEKLNTEWDSFLLLATVMLSVDVSFLTIQSVDTTSQGDPANSQRTIIQISSYVSIVTTMGSLVIGLLLIRQSRTKARDTAEEASQFLETMSRTPLGLETIAIIYALPYALLMWGTLAFGVAFSSLCFMNTLYPTRISVGIPGCLVFMLVVWCIWAAWEQRDHFWLDIWDRIRDIQFSKLVNFVRPESWIHVIKDAWRTGRNPHAEAVRHAVDAPEASTTDQSAPAAVAASV